MLTFSGVGIHALSNIDRAHTHCLLTTTTALGPGLRLLFRSIVFDLFSSVELLRPGD